MLKLIGAFVFILFGIIPSNGGFLTPSQIFETENIINIQLQTGNINALPPCPTSGFHLFDGIWNNCYGDSAQASYLIGENPTNVRYTGEYRRGKPNGFGKAIYAFGAIYEGNWVDGVKSGRGTYIFTQGQWSGDRYYGDFQNELFHGEGIYFFKNGAKYVGGFQNDKFHGLGVTYRSDNSVEYEGLWQYGSFYASQPVPNKVNQAQRLLNPQNAQAEKFFETNNNSEPLKLNQIKNWQQLTKNWKLCVSLLLENNGYTFDLIQQQNIKPDDMRITEVMRSCDNIINRPLRRDYACSIQGRQSVCDEYYVGSTSQKIEIDDAIKMAAAGQSLYVRPFEKQERIDKAKDENELINSCTAGVFVTLEKSLRACEESVQRFADNRRTRAENFQQYWRMSLNCFNRTGNPSDNYQSCRKTFYRTFGTADTVPPIEKKFSVRLPWEYRGKIRLSYAIAIHEYGKFVSEPQEQQSLYQEAFSEINNAIKSGIKTEEIYVRKGNLVLDIVKTIRHGLNLGELTESGTGDRDKQLAISAFKQALAINPNSVDAKRGLEFAIK